MLLGGCGPSVIVHDYPNLGIRIYQTTASRVHKECGGSDYKACAYSGEKPCEIWAYDANDLTHELTHCDGGDEDAAKKEDW